MSMRFGCNPQINFCHFFGSLNFVVFGLTSTKAYRQWLFCEGNSYNFTHILKKNSSFLSRCEHDTCL